MAKYKPRRALLPEDELPDEQRPENDRPAARALPEPEDRPSTDAGQQNAGQQNADRENADTADTIVQAAVGPSPTEAEAKADTDQADNDKADTIVQARIERPSTETDNGKDDEDEDTVILARAKTRATRPRASDSEDEDWEQERSNRKAARKSRRVWRASGRTLTLVTVAAVLAIAALSVIAYLLYLDSRPLLLIVGAAGLALAVLIYVWRMAWHPRLVSDGTRLTVHNPLRTRVIDWATVTLITPGLNGMIIGTDDAQIEAWCVQKGRSSTKRGRHTRADRVAAELWELLDTVDPPMSDPELGLRIRRSRPNEAQLLTRLERATNEQALAHIFPPNRFPYPVNEIAQRWQRTLRERKVRVRILEKDEAPVAYIAYDHETIRHLGVLPRHTRRGYGTALLTFAEEDIFSSGSQQVQLWVLTENRAARGFYRAHGWVETEDRRRSEFPPKPDELRMIKSSKRPEPGPTE